MAVTACNLAVGAYVAFVVQLVNQVLCAVDFSDRSIEACRYAAGLCSRLDARMSILHVFEVPSYASVPDGSTTVLAASIDESVRRVSEQLRAELDTLAQKLEPARTVKTILRDGIAEQVIVDVAEELFADLIVLGTYGRSGLSRWLVGSVTERVVRAAKCPVLVVPAMTG
jgi:nucleotide-binding universal stress UspA family protein